MSSTLTAKEAAIELVDKFRKSPIEIDGGEQLKLPIAKQCAIISIKDTINILKTYEADMPKLSAEIEFHNSVIDEIKKITTIA